MFSNQNKLGFPVDYGDSPLDNEDRLSVSVVKGIKSKQFRNIISGLFSVILILGSNARPANAIPAEAGECIADIAEAAAAEMPQGVPAGTVAGTAAGRAAAAPGPAPLPAAGAAAGRGAGRFELGTPGAPLGPGGPGGPPAPGQPPIHLGIPRPVTTLSRGGNTVIFAGSIGWICLNAYWGDPVAIAGCSVMIGTWFLSVIGIRVGT